MKNVLEYLEAAVRANPEKTAAADEQTSLTYRRLWEEARGIGSALASLNCANRPVAVYMGRGVRSLAAMLGVVYSGNFYVVMDADMPLDRMSVILDTLRPAAILTEEGRDPSPVFHGPVFGYEQAVTEPVRDDTLAGIRKRSIDTDPLYALFTSGSTGIPKGAVICHRSVMAYAQWVTETFDIGPETVFGNQTPFTFSMSVLDIFSTLKNGATLQIIPKKFFSFPVNLMAFLNERKVNTIYWVPSALCIVANSRILNYVRLPHLRKVLFAGEVMPVKQLNIWLSHMPELFYANLYGPTEVTDICAYYVVDRPFRDDEALPIGSACNNCGVLVLTPDGREAAPGEPGELCVRGSFLAMGYYGNPEKTADAFVQNPLNPHYPELIYKTGDLVRYNELGELLYLGRKDFQIKHMGYRIELGEIETAAGSLPQMGSCACLFDPQADRIVLVYDGQIKEEALWDGLRKKLPKYMIPNHTVPLKRMPLNANGKIDRAHLKEQYLTSNRNGE